MQRTVRAVNTSAFTFPSHTITWEQDLSTLRKHFSPIDLETFLTLYELAASSPKKALKEGKEFFRRYNADPSVLNLLTYLYLSRKKGRKSEKLIRENYRLNPTNLIARINFADQCLRKKKKKRIPEIFEGKTNLRDLYPERKTFHISEFRGFLALMGHYHVAIKEKEIAGHFLKILESLPGGAS